MKKDKILAVLLPVIFAAAPAFTDDAAKADLVTCVTSVSDRSAGLACVGQYAAVCMEQGNVSSAIDAAKCFDEETVIWDELLNTGYQDLISAAKEIDTQETASLNAEENLRNSQRAWIAFRDAECLYRGNMTSGTGHYTDGSECLLDVTAHRVLDFLGYGAFYQSD